MATLVLELRGEQAMRAAKLLQQELRKTAGAATQADAATSKMGKTLGGVERDMKKMVAGFVAFGVAITAARKAISGLSDSVRVFTEFEASMTRINTLVGISQEQLAAWEDDLISIANVTGKTGHEMSEALFAITSGGIRGAEAMDVLERSAKAGAIGLGETDAIARAVVASMIAFADQNLSAAEATDILVGTVREGQLEASALAPVLGRVNAIAAQMGVRFADVGGFIAAFTQQGVNAEEAVTALRAALNLVLNPADGVRKAMAELGVDLDEVRRVMRDEGLIQGFGLLTTAADGNLDAIGELIPNVRALAGIMATAGTDLERMIGIQQRVRDSTGSVSDGFETWGQTSEAAFARFRSASDSLKEAIGKELTPAVTDLVKALTDIVEQKDAIVSSLQAIGAALKVLSGYILVEGATNVLTWAMPTEEDREEFKARWQAALDDARSYREQIAAALSQTPTGVTGPQDVAGGLEAIMQDLPQWSTQFAEVERILSSDGISGELESIRQEIADTIKTTDDWGGKVDELVAKYRKQEIRETQGALNTELEETKKHLKEIPGQLQDALQVMRELRDEAERLADLEDLGLDQLWDRFSEAEGFDNSKLTQEIQDSLQRSIDDAFSNPDVYGGMGDAIIASGSLDYAISQVTAGVIESGTEVAADPQRLKKIGENLGSTLAGTLTTALTMALQGQDWESIGSAVGGAIGTAIGATYGPGGAAAGGAIGSLAGGLFGSLFDDDDAEEALAAAEEFAKALQKTFDPARQEVIAGIESVVEWMWRWANGAGDLASAMEGMSNELEALVEDLTGIVPEDFGSRLAAATELFATLPQTIESVHNEILDYYGIQGEESSDTEVGQALQDMMNQALAGLDLSSFADQLIQEFQGITAGIDLASLSATFDALRDAINGAGFSAEETAAKLAVLKQAYRDQIATMRADALMPLLQMMQQFGVFENKSRQEQAKLMRQQAQIELRLIEAQLEALGVMDATIRGWVSELRDAIKDFDFSVPEIRVSMPADPLPIRLPAGPIPVEVQATAESERDATRDWWAKIVDGVDKLIAQYNMSDLEYALHQIDEQFQISLDYYNRDDWRRHELEQAYANARQEALERAYAPITNLLDQLRDQGLSPRESFESLRGEFFELADAVRSGDTDSIQELAAAGGDYAAAIRAMFGNTRAAQMMIEEIEAQLEEIVGDAGLTVDEKQLDEMETQTSYLADIAAAVSGDPMLYTDSSGAISQLKLSTEDAARAAAQQRDRQLETLSSTQETTHRHLVELIERTVENTRAIKELSVRRRVQQPTFTKPTVGGLT